MRLRLQSVLLSLAVTGTAGFPVAAQSQGPAYESIHELEWRRHAEFVQTAPLPKFHGRPSALVPKRQRSHKEIFGYLPFWVYSNYPDLKYELLTTIAYFGAEIDEFGEIANLHHWPAAGLIDRAHRHGVKVVLTAILFNPNQLASLLSDPDRRSNLVSNLLAAVTDAGADGVTIDFEGVPAGQESNLTAFMTELTATFYSQMPGASVTIFTPAIDWRDVFDYAALAEITDGLIMQGYDFHWSTGPTAGPIAPLTGDRWGPYNVTNTVHTYLAETGFDRGKLILGVPFYGLEWPTESDTLESPTLDVAESLFYNEAQPRVLTHGRLWDAESLTPWYKYQGHSWRQGWYDDSLSLANKFELVDTEDLRGIGIWALSYDAGRSELQGAIDAFFGDGFPTTVADSEGPDASPNLFSLRQNYPNPFNPSTTIAFKLRNTTPQPTRLTIYDIAGRKVRILFDETASAGGYTISWDGRDRKGAEVASGLYVSRLQVGHRVETKKMLLLR